MRFYVNAHTRAQFYLDEIRRKEENFGVYYFICIYKGEIITPFEAT